MPDTQLTAFRGAMLHSRGDPTTLGREASYEFLADGLLLVRGGRIEQFGPAAQLLRQLPDGLPVTRFSHSLLLPGLVDAHTHYPQTGMIAAYGEQLLDWLQDYTFPTERRFADPDYAQAVAARFLDELLRNGTTTAMVFCTVHPCSVDALFAEAEARHLRLLAGKVLMDRNAPADLTDTAETGLAQSRALIERWHGRGRLQYAVAPRFAPTSTGAQLATAGRLLQAYPDLRLQTHLAESRQEVDWVRKLYPEHASYLAVYAHYGLVTERSLFAHGVHLSDSDCGYLADQGAALAFCPSANLFLGSGLFDLARMERHGVPVALGTDLGAGTSFSLLQTLGDGYKVQQLLGRSLDPFKSLYLATLGGAKALGLDQHIGGFAPGLEADFVVLDTQATPLLRFRLEQAKTLAERLFVLFTLGDDRVVRETFVLGESAYRRQNGG